MYIRIDGSNMGKVYKGAGMVSGNNSSRLLLDYKYEHPGRYQELLEHIFGKCGVGVTHFKLEMGSDINSSSGTEPCVMRYEDEPADVRRGAGFILAADAKKINPELTLDMLYWSEPKWVTDAQDVYAARYKWYKENLKAAYEVFGLEFDYVSASRNERAVDGEWIKYFAERLRSETDCPYDFSGIKIVAADEENSWHISDMMMADAELRDAVDIVASHYTSHSTENTRILSDKYGKELWFSEGSPPMSYPEGTCRFDGSGLAGINGVLDIANRIIAMYPCGGMTLYEYQPVAAAYYDGVTYCHKQLITACEPWSGFYSLDCGYYMSLHFSRFIRKGWKFIDNACYCDGEKGGDGHALVNTVHSFMTAADPETGDYSVVIVNSTDKPITYDLAVSGLAKACNFVNIWETRGPDSGAYDENYFRKSDIVTPCCDDDGMYKFTLTVKPFSMITASTLETESPKACVCRSEILHLPYEDDFTYKEYENDYLTSRGGAPRFTTDQGGAFEVCRLDGKNVLMQMITPETKAMEWGATPLPTTNFGDDRWYNCEMSAKVRLTSSDKPDENYAGIGLRFNLAAVGVSGYALLLSEDGTWKFNRSGVTKLSGKYSQSKSAVLRISAEGDRICGYIDGNAVFEYSDSECNSAMLGAGRAALYSSYNNNCFEYVKILPLGNNPYVTRFDDTDSCFDYEGGWEHRLMSGFCDYRRTVSSGNEGDKFTLKFSGSGFGIFGSNNKNAVISVLLDKNDIGAGISLPVSGSREIFYRICGLESGCHTAEITILSGNLNIDGVQIEP